MASTLCVEKSIKKRLEWIDIIKGVGIILVVLCHICSNDILHKWAYSFHMPLFFFAAGWLYKKSDVLKNIKRRLYTIVVPYFSFGLLILVYWYLVERKFRDSSMGLLDSFIGLLRGQYNLLDFNVHLWFLPAFFLTCILYNILVNIGGNKIAYIVSIAMSAVYIGVCMFGEVPYLPWGLERVFKFIGFYAIGHFLASYKTDELVQKIPLAVKIPSAVILFGINFALAYFSLTKYAMRYVAAMFGISACIMFAMIIKKNSVLQYLGRISLVILCIHGPIYRVLVKIMSVPLNMTTEALRSNIFFAIIVTAVTIGICAGAYEIISRIMPFMIGKSRKPVALKK